MTIEERNELVLENLNLVHGLISRYIRPSRDEYDDYFQVGCEALILAAERFDPSPGFKFITFAGNYILGYCKTYRRANQILKINRQFFDTFNRIVEWCEKKGINTDAHDLTELTSEQIQECCKKLQISKKTFDGALSAIYAIDTWLSRDDETTFESLDLQSFSAREALDNVLTFVGFQQLLNRVLAQFYPKHQEIYRDYLYSKLSGNWERGFQQSALAKKYGVTQSQISRVIKKVNSAVQQVLIDERF